MLETASGPLVELPAHWSLDDWNQYMYLPDPRSGPGTVHPPSRAIQLWREELDGMRRHGCLFCLTMHPFLSGRPGPVEGLRGLVEYALGCGDVEFVSCGEAARARPRRREPAAPAAARASSSARSIPSRLRRVTGPPYRPIDARIYPRFAGVRTFMRLPHVTDLTGVDAAVYGIPFDTAVTFRPGARFGPEAIRSASALLRPFHSGFGIDLCDALSIVDYGDLPVAPGDTEGTYRRVEEALAPVVEAGAFPLALGGDHSITLAELRVIAKRHGPLALVQLDAHGDTWDEYFDQRYFHGTTFRRAAEEGLIDPAASVQAGMRGPLFQSSDLDDGRALGFQVIPSEELRALGPEAYGELVRERVGERPVFLSFDVDFLDPAYAPGTGTPEVAGFSTAEAIAFLRSLKGIALAGADVVEVSPPYDGPGQTTALAAANVAWEILALRAAYDRATRSGGPHENDSARRPSRSRLRRMAEGV